MPHFHSHGGGPVSARPESGTRPQSYCALYSFFRKRLASFHNVTACNRKLIIYKYFFRIGMFGQCQFHWTCNFFELVGGNCRTWWKTIRNQEERTYNLNKAPMSIIEHTICWLRHEAEVLSREVLWFCRFYPYSSWPEVLLRRLQSGTSWDVSLELL